MAPKQQNPGQKANSRVGRPRELAMDAIKPEAQKKKPPSRNWGALKALDQLARASGLFRKSSSGGCGIPYPTERGSYLAQ